MLHTQQKCLFEMQDTVAFCLLACRNHIISMVTMLRAYVLLLSAENVIFNPKEHAREAINQGSNNPY